MTKREFAENAVGVCKRPRMYTLHGTLPEVLAYLEGLAKGVNLQPGSHHGLSDFFRWLARKLGKEESPAWEELLLTFGDEEAALSAFARLYREYAELEAATESEQSSTDT